MQFDRADDLLGVDIETADGMILGRASVVHVPRGSRQPLFVQLPKDAPRQWIVPLFGSQATTAALVLGYGAATVYGAPATESTTGLSIGEAAYVLLHFGVVVDVTGLSITDRLTRPGDVSSVHPRVRELPMLPMRAAPGDPELPPIVVIKPGFTGEGRQS